MWKWLTLFRDVFYALVFLTKKTKKISAKKKLGDALEKSVEERDQQHIESSIASDAGNPSNYEYEQLRTRPSKKRS